VRTWIRLANSVAPAARHSMGKTVAPRSSAAAPRRPAASIHKHRAKRPAATAALLLKARLQNEAARLATLPRASRYAQHRRRVVTRALALLDGGGGAEDAELQLLLGELRL